MLKLAQLLQSEWAPDFGPAEFVPQWGATLVGARKFLIAYNVNLLSTKEQAHRIALDVREQGRGTNQVSYAVVCTVVRHETIGRLTADVFESADSRDPITN
jgi:glutamate formiminotransferase